MLMTQMTGDPRMHSRVLMKSHMEVTTHVRTGVMLGPLLPRVHPHLPVFRTRKCSLVCKQSQLYREILVTQVVDRSLSCQYLTYLTLAIPEEDKQVEARESIVS